MRPAKPQISLRTCLFSYGFCSVFGYGFPSVFVYRFPSVFVYGFPSVFGYGFPVYLVMDFPVYFGYGFPSVFGYGFPSVFGFPVKKRLEADEARIKELSTNSSFNKAEHHLPLLTSRQQQTAQKTNRYHVSMHINY